MSILAATCATLLATVSVAQGGDTIRVTGDCPKMVIKRDFPSKVTIDGSAAKVAGLQLIGSNIGWRGGTLTAPHGLNGVAREGYAVYLEGTNLSVSYSTITGAQKGVVVFKSRNIRIDHNAFRGLRNDGVNVNQVTNLTIEYNGFSDPFPVPTTCTIKGVVTTGLARRDCLGVWKDGDHAGGVQLRNNVVNARVRFNFVIGNFSGGISQNDLAGVDLPLRDVMFESNLIIIPNWSAMQLQQNCIDCGIFRNVVRNGRPDRKASIIYGAAKHCGNDVEAGPVDPPCI